MNPKQNNFTTKNMAKVILEFDASEEQTELRAALDGIRWSIVVHEIDQALRSTVKHGTSVIGEKTASDTEYWVAEKYRTLIREMLEEHNLKLY
jgi:hypothetical protein